MCQIHLRMNKPRPRRQTVFSYLVLRRDPEPRDAAKCSLSNTHASKRERERRSKLHVRFSNSDPEIKSSFRKENWLHTGRYLFHFFVAFFFLFPNSGTHSRRVCQLGIGRGGGREIPSHSHTPPVFSYVVVGRFILILFFEIAIHTPCWGFKKGLPIGLVLLQGVLQRKQGGEKATALTEPTVLVRHGKTQKKTIIFRMKLFVHSSRKGFQVPALSEKCVSCVCARQPVLDPQQRMRWLEDFFSTVCLLSFQFAAEKKSLHARGDQQEQHFFQIKGKSIGWQALNSEMERC